MFRMQFSVVALSAFIVLALVSPNSALGVTIVQGGEDYIAFEAEKWVTVVNGGGTDLRWLETTASSPGGGGGPPSDGKAMFTDDTNGTNRNSTMQWTLKFDQQATYYAYYRWRSHENYSSSGSQWSGNSMIIGEAFDLAPDAWASETNDVDWDHHQNDWYITKEDDGSYVIDAGNVNTNVTYTVLTREQGFILDRVAFHTSSGLSAAQVDALVNSAPEPATLSLLALGGLAMLRRRRK